MLMTLLGIVTLVKLVLPKNALSPMLVTGKPFVVLGIMTFPPGPVYPVMVIAPLLVVKVNWAGATAGFIKSASEQTTQIRHNAFMG